MHWNYQPGLLVNEKTRYPLFSDYLRFSEAAVLL